MARIKTAAIAAAALWIWAPAPLNAQVGLLDDAARAAAKAGKAAKLQKLGRLAVEMTDKAGRLLKHTAASAETRRAFGLGLGAVATDSFASTPAAASRLRVYAGLADDDLKYLADTGKHAASTAESLHPQQYVETLRSAGQTIEGVDYFAEADVLERRLVQPAATDRIFLPNYGATPWRVVNGQELGYAAEVRPSLWVKVATSTVEDFRYLLDLEFNASDLRVASLFDDVADPESIAAIRRAASGVTFRNIETAGDAVAFVGEKRGRVVALVGHVEGEDFIVRGMKEEKFRVKIDALLAEAEARDVSLLLLGCDTAFVEAGGGIAGQINSVAMASRLREALQATTYGEFLAALGTADNPLVVSRGTLGQMQFIVANRLKREARGERAGVTSVHASTKLARLQTNNAAQTFRSLPAWADSAITAMLGLLVLAYLYAAVASVFQKSLSPLRTTNAVLVGVALLPVVFVKWVREPR